MLENCFETNYVPTIEEVAENESQLEKKGFWNWMPIAELFSFSLS